jgi:predicted TIM-barrel fold metal-dependent hydrolase
VEMIDIHRRIVPDVAEDALFRVPERGDFTSWIAATPLTADKKENTHYAVLPPAFYALSQGLADTRRLNDLMRAVRTANGGHAPAAFGIVEPHHGEAALEEIDRIAGELRLTGIVWRHRAHGVYADVPIMTKFVARAAERGLVPMMYASPGSMNESLWRVWNLAEQFPSVPMIALGALADWEHLQQIMATPERAANVHYDTSDFFGEPDDLAAVAKRLGAHRLVYGGGGCGAAPKLDHDFGDRLAQSALADDVKRAILSGNARRLLRLDGASS